MSFLLDQPAVHIPTRRPRQNFSPPVKEPIKDKIQFLDYLQNQRNHLLCLNQKKRKSIQEIEKLKLQLLASKDWSKKYDINKKIQILQRNVKTSQVLSLGDFDRKILPFLDLYHNKSVEEKIDDEQLIRIFQTEFLSKEYAPLFEIAQTDTCPKCNKEFLRSTEEAALICGDCGRSVKTIDATTDSIAYGDEIEYSSFSYKRMNHLIEWLNHFQAKEATPVPDAIIEEVMQNLYEQRISSIDQITFAMVKKAQKATGKRKYYDQTTQIWSRITGKNPVRLDPECEEKIRLMFIRIQIPFEKHCPSTRVNHLSYPYCLYKFCQILKYDELLPYFSLLKGRQKLQNQEDIFKKICQDLSWEFIPVCDQHKTTKRKLN